MAKNAETYAEDSELTTELRSYELVERVLSVVAVIEEEIEVLESVSVAEIVVVDDDKLASDDANELTSDDTVELTLDDADELSADIVAVESVVRPMAAAESCKAAEPSAVDDRVVSPVADAESGGGAEL